jgi:hypothetical protein
MGSQAALLELMEQAGEGWYRPVIDMRRKLAPPAPKSAAAGEPTSGY